MNSLNWIVRNGWTYESCVECAVLHHAGSWARRNHVMSIVMLSSSPTLWQIAIDSSGWQGLNRSLWHSRGLKWLTKMADYENGQNHINQSELIFQRPSHLHIPHLLYLILPCWDLTVILSYNIVKRPTFTAVLILQIWQAGGMAMVRCPIFRTQKRFCSLCCPES